MPTLDDLRIFLAVLRRGTITAAGEEVHLSQPAVTRRIQALERRLGTRLFEREGRRLRLTAAGVHFQLRAEAILAQVSDLATELAHFDAGAGGRLCVGATVTACTYLLPLVFRRFRERYPEHQLVVRNDRSARIGDLVFDRRIEVGVASVGVPREGVRAIPWQELALALVSPEDDPAPPSRIADLDGAPVVLPAAGTLRGLADALLAREAVTPRVVAECDSLEVVRALVASGFGSALLPRVCLEGHTGVMDVGGDPAALPRLPVAVLVPEGRPFTPTVRSFLEAMGLRA